VSGVVWALIGVALGFAAAATLQLLRKRADAELARRLVEQAQAEKLNDLSAMINEVKAVFSSMSREALSSNTDDFLKLAKTRLEQQTEHGEQALDTKKKLIDARLEEMDKKLRTLNELIERVEKHRAESFGSLRAGLERATEATNRLQDSTASLREALSSPQRRGQWGERMAEDVLRLAGFVEGINYVKQQTVSEGTRPDFTFMLPDNQFVHMDVKFPLANYLRMLEASDDAARSAAAAQFLRDVRARVKEVTTREYIDTAGGTVDYVLVFIPNEQVYGFIHEQDRSLLDDALRSKVVLCAPLTLYAVLAVIRQAVDNFRLERISSQILDLLEGFRKNWGRYVEVMDKLGKRLDDAAKEYQQLVGVRTRQLDRQLDKIDDLRAVHEEKEAGLLPTQSRPTLPDTNRVIDD